MSGLPPIQLYLKRAQAIDAGRVSSTGHLYDEDGCLLLTPEEEAELVARVTSQEHLNRCPDYRLAKQREAHDREFDELRVEQTMAALWAAGSNDENTQMAKPTTPSQIGEIQ